MTYREIEMNVIQWGEDRGIVQNATAMSQAIKTLEETTELLDALEDIIDEAQGSPILCAYAYRSDAERIMERFKALRPINLTECKSKASLTNAMHRWKTGDCRLMICHPASMGHGIDGLQKNGHILVWYGLNWSLDRSLDLYEQFNARVRRQGQGTPVICHHLYRQSRGV